MGIKVRGLQEAKRNLDRLIDDITDRKVVRALQSAMLIGGAQAAIYTPVDTSTLLNSQFREIIVNGTVITGRVGYSAEYALYVHQMTGKLKGQPRAHFGKTREGTEFGGGTGTGNYWDPHGEPQFLTRGFEESRDQIDAVIRKELSL
ncbi:HK97 gp10 family phage protein [Pantoea sp. App145]|uniref:HK97 gp10 family phage protein n=1 Tax=Pantoea sp. App145 TaxID=3071567 RepID=UPI003A7FECEE